MGKKRIVLVVAALLGFAGVVQAQQEELHGYVDVAYLSRNVWRGFDIFPNNHSAIQPSINLDLYGTGFGVNAMMTRANSSGFENGERWDYTLYYNNSLFNEENYATNYRLSYVYYNFPDNSSHTRSSIDLQEMNAVLSWPKICPFGIVPTYVLVRMWPSNSDSPVSKAANWAHIFCLDYGLSIAGLLPEIPEQVLKLHAEVVYNDGVDPRPNGPGVDHDWSDAVFGVSTDFNMGNGLVFTPGVYHQISMDDSVNTKDETWVSLAMRYKF